MDLNENIHKTIELDLYKSKNSKILSGRPKGQRARNKENIDNIIKDIINGKKYSIDVKVSEDTFAIASSFFLEMFSKAIKTLGKDDFLTIFRFQVPESVKEGIMEDINYCVKS